MYALVSPNVAASYLSRPCKFETLFATSSGFSGSNSCDLLSPREQSSFWFMICNVLLDLSRTALESTEALIVGEFHGCTLAGVSRFVFCSFSLIQFFLSLGTRV